MKEEYCGSCGNILRFPESARKVFCDQCDTQWQVIRTGNILSLAPMGVMQTEGQEETLQKRLKDLDRQVRIKREYVDQIKKQIDAIVVDIKPLPMGAIAGGIVFSLFFLAGAAGAWFFKMTLISPMLATLALVPVIGLPMYKRQINAEEREKIDRKKELIGQLASMKGEMDALAAKKQQARDEAEIGD